MLFHLKCIFAGGSVAGRYQQACETLAEAEKYFDQMSKGISKDDLKKWDADITRAEMKRVNNVAAMDIMAARIRCPVTNVPPSRHNPSDNWVQAALDIEEDQFIIIL